MKYLILIIPIFFILFYSLKVFLNHCEKGFSIPLKKFKDSDIFDFDFKDFKSKSESLFNRQKLYFIFDDNSKVNLFGAIEDKSIIPLVSAVTNVSEDDVRAGSMSKKLDLNSFMKGFEVHYLKDVEILDKDLNFVDYSISKGFLHEDNHLLEYIL